MSSRAQMDPDSPSSAPCTSSLPFKSWEPKRQVLKPGCVYLHDRLSEGGWRFVAPSAFLVPFSHCTCVSCEQ